MSSAELRELERSIEQAKAHIELGNALERLRSNRDFRTVIQRGFLETEAVRLVHEKAEAPYQSLDEQRRILSRIDAIGYLRQYLLGLEGQAEQARKTLEQDEQTRDEILAEDSIK